MNPMRRYLDILCESEATNLPLEPSGEGLSWLWHEKYDETFDRMMSEYYGGGFERQPWKVVPAARLIRIWNDTAKTGVVRDTKGLDAIADLIIENIVRLYINTELGGHTRTDPKEMLRDLIDDDEQERFIDWAVDLENGGWRLSDAGFPRLINLAALIYEADDAEAKLAYIDMVLNVVHARSDLASWFVQGGTATLNQLASDEPPPIETQPAPAAREDPMTAELGKLTPAKQRAMLIKLAQVRHPEQSLDALRQRVAALMPKDLLHFLVQYNSQARLDANEGAMVSEAAEPMPDIPAMFRAGAWDALMDNLAENESELEDFVSDYEDATGNELDVPPDKQMVRGGELYDRKFKRWLRNHVADKAEGEGTQYLALFRNGVIRGYRALTAPPDWQPSGPNPGIHWSRNRQQAIAHFGDEEDGHVTHIVVADIPLTSINWERTIKAILSQEFGDEEEITINDDAPVKIVKVTGTAPPKNHQPASKPAMASPSKLLPKWLMTFKVRGKEVMGYGQSDRSTQAVTFHGTLGKELAYDEIEPAAFTAMRHAFMDRGEGWFTPLSGRPEIEKWLAAKMPPPSVEDA